jgi:anti-sigma28 factor (negative regulator of flagellin synthesis)
MKISDVSADKPVSDVRENRSTSAPAAGPTSQSADQVSLGSVAAAVSKALESSNQRVAELRQQYVSGTYKVDAAALSAKIVNDHID